MVVVVVGYSTGRQKPHRCWPLVNKVKNIDYEHAKACPYIPPRKYRFPWRDLIRPPPVHPKRHLNRFIRFAGLTLVTNRQKDIQRDHATCVTTGRISWLCIVMRPNDQCWMTSFTVWEHIAAGYITYAAFLCNLSLSECNYSRAWFWHCWTMVANFSNAGAKQQMQAASRWDPTEEAEHRFVKLVIYL